MPVLFTVRRDGPPVANPLSVAGYLVGKDRKFQHTFGGFPRHSGVTHRDCPKPWHLLIDLDLADPRVTVRVPGIRWLSLYNAFQYDSSSIQYQLVTDTEAQIVFQDKMKFTPDFPYAGFPEHLPKLPVTVGDPFEIEFAGDNEENWWTLFCDNGETAEPDRNQLCGLEVGINQMPSVGTIECKTCGCCMDLLAAFPGDFAEFDFSIWNGYQYVVIVYHVCPSCFTIAAANLAN